MSKKPISAGPVLKRIEQRLKTLGMSANKASTEAGSRHTIRTMRKNVKNGTQRGVSTETIARFAPVLKTSTEWLSHGIGSESIEGVHIESSDVLTDMNQKPAQRMVPLVGYVGAGDEANFYAVAQGQLDEVPAPADSSPETVACLIRH